jgi:predicted RNA-binding Zn-ribbon protein involved in translation (DUF1610 family)
MPIRAEYRGFYTCEWREYRDMLLMLRGKRCTTCRRETLRYLNLSHDSHDPLTSSVSFRCPSCHARHDAAHRLAVWRRNRAARHGQLWLLPEIEYAATPAWAIPREVFAAIDAARQGALFA